MHNPRIVSKYWFDYANSALDHIESVKDIIRKEMVKVKASREEWIAARDARSNLFIGTKKILQAVQLSYAQIRLSLVDIEYWDKFVKDFKRDEIEHHIKEYNVLILTGWLYGVSTIMEESFRLIVLSLGIKDANKRDDFSFIYSLLFKALNLEGYLPLLDVFRLVRNCIHTNGIFFPKNKQDRRLTFKGKNYEFVVGKPLSFVNSVFLLDITAELVFMFTDITLSQAVSDIPLMPRFSRQSEKGPA